MNKEQAEEYTQSLGQIVGGSWRQILWAEQQGIPKALGLSTRDWAQQRLGGYVRMAIDDRREAVKELAANGHSTRAIAEVVGVDHSTVVRDIAGANAPEPMQPDAQAQESGANAPAPPDAAAVDRGRANQQRRLTLFHALRDTLMGLRFFADSKIDLSEFFTIEDRKDFDRFLRDDYALEKLTPAIEPGVDRLLALIKQLRDDYEL